MSILSELNSLLESIKLPVETGIFSGMPPNEYAVLTPLSDSFAILEIINRLWILMKSDFAFQ